MTSCNPNFSIKKFLLAGVLAASISGWSCRADAIPWVETDASNVQSLIVPDSEDVLRDAASNGKPRVMGGSVENDSRFGRAVKFGDAADNEIVIEDRGRFDFSKGFTFEAWVKFGEQDYKDINGSLFSKLGTLVSYFDKGKISLRWITLPTDTVYAEKGQLNYHPVETNNFNGAREIPLNQWVHVSITYDPSMKVLRSWIDRGLDRVRYLTVDEPEQAILQIKPGNAISLFKGLKNFQLAGARISGAAIAMDSLPAMEIYAHQLPYHGKGEIGLLIDHISPDLKFPVELVAYWENHTGQGNVVERFTLENAERKTLTFAPPGWKNAIYSLHIQAFENGREIQRWDFQMSNPHPSNNANVRFGEDRMPIRNGRKFFPLVIYRVPAEDFQKAADMGFNILTPFSHQYTSPRITPEKTALFQKWFEAAESANVTLMPGINANQIFYMQRFADEKSLFGWITADEPWGLSLERLRNTYNTIKMVSPDVPVYIVQNNTSRVQETSEYCDIIARDVYPVPSVPFRGIAAETRKAIRDSGGFKPVWMIVCQYETKIPTYEQLRCMLYLAIAGGGRWRGGVFMGRSRA